MGVTVEGRIKQLANKHNIKYSVWMQNINNGLKWCFKCKCFHAKELFSIDNSRYDKLQASCTKSNRVTNRINTKGRISSFKGKNHSEEAKAVMRVNNLGNTNPNWKGGITTLLNQIRNTAEYKIWRYQVYLNGNFTCANCDTKKIGRNIILDADHIYPLSKIVFENNVTSVEEALLIPQIWDTSNGRCLCRACHKKTDSWGVNTNKN